MIVKTAIAIGLLAGSALLTVYGLTAYVETVECTPCHQSADCYEFGGCPFDE